MPIHEHPPRPPLRDVLRALLDRHRERRRARLIHRRARLERIATRLHRRMQPLAAHVNTSPQHQDVLVIEVDRVWKRTRSGSMVWVNVIGLGRRDTWFPGYLPRRKAVLLVQAGNCSGSGPLYINEIHGTFRRSQLRAWHRLHRIDRKIDRTYR